MVRLKQCRPNRFAWHLPDSSQRPLLRPPRRLFLARRNDQTQEHRHHQFEPHPGIFTMPRLPRRRRRRRAPRQRKRVRLRMAATRPPVRGLSQLVRRSALLSTFRREQIEEAQEVQFAAAHDASAQVRVVAGPGTGGQWRTTPGLDTGQRRRRRSAMLVGGMRERPSQPAVSGGPSSDMSYFSNRAATVARSGCPLRVRGPSSS